jgi:hypothetical protein
MELMKSMAVGGKLQPAVDIAKAKYKERVAEHMKKKGGAGW